MNNPYPTTCPYIKVARPVWLCERMVPWLGIGCDVLLVMICILVLLLFCQWLGKIGCVIFIVLQVVLSIAFAFVNGSSKCRNSIRVVECNVLSRLGFPSAQYELGSDCLTKAVSDKARREAVMWLQKAADGWNVFAKWKLGRVYSCSVLTRDLRMAYSCFRDAAEAGHLGAACAVGCCHEDGRGVEKCPEEAARWYLRAANYGLAPAMHNAGCCYKMGMGVEKDEEKAEMWFDRASECGFYNNGRSRDDGTEKDYSAIELWNLFLLHHQPEWNRQFSDDFLDRELARIRQGDIGS